MLIVGLRLFVFVYNANKKANDMIKIYTVKLSEWYKQTIQNDKTKACIVPPRPVRQGQHIPAFVFGPLMIGLILLGSSNTVFFSLARPMISYQVAHLVLTFIEVFADAVIIAMSLILFMASCMMFFWSFFEYQITDYRHQAKIDIHALFFETFLKDNKLTNFTIETRPGDFEKNQKVQIVVGVNDSNQPFISEVIPE